MNNLVNVAVLGSTGYVGMELVHLLSKHENININFLGSDSIEEKYLTNIDNTKEYNDLPLLKNNKLFNPSISDYVFLALPHSISNQYVKKFFGKIKIIDLSADFRLDNINIYQKNYGDNHTCSEYLNQFIYGLVEFNHNKISKAKNIAVPGCYPTSILLPLIPILKNRLIMSDNIVIDSKSGYSGAGKNFNLKNIKSDNDYNFYNYNTNSHRHISEINQELLKFNYNKKLSFSFNPHILPNFRGMMSTIYCNLNNGVNKSDIINTYKEFDNDNYFIKFIEDETRADFFSVQNTNFCNIKLFNHDNDNKIIIVSNIDNLIKGASGQAIQCFNIMENFEETKALL
tara:strand:+ start:1452 stop:2480 length:1029 start_codon:yes stop_codon:yes gene_type:complete